MDIFTKRLHISMWSPVILNTSINVYIHKEQACGKRKPPWEKKGEETLRGTRHKGEPVTMDLF